MISDATGKEFIWADSGPSHNASQMQLMTDPRDSATQILSMRLGFLRISGTLGI